MELQEFLKRFENCECGEMHECAIRDIRIGSGITPKTGEILKENGFPKKLLVVADQNTLRAAEGVQQALTEFDVTYLLYEDLRVATMNDVRKVEAYLQNGLDGVLAVGTGSIHDPCRLACANLQKPLCLFATAPSMDGFASYSAPIVNGNFKITYPAKCPEVIIADTKILAKAPVALKSAGFGDMVAKYIALIDWQVSHLISGEQYCKKVAGLTRYAVDSVMRLADRVTEDSEEAAAKIFEGLLLTGIAMSFTKTSRPGSGTEHIFAHYIECKELLEHKIPTYHGEDVGITTLQILRLYKSLLNVPSVRARKEENDWAEIEAVYGELAADMKKLNTPNTITDEIDPKLLETHWREIQEIIRSVPTLEEVEAKMLQAGCLTDFSQSGKPDKLIKEAFLYHPYMRRRLSLRRLLQMTDVWDLCKNK
ncbi:MAG: iron-containing alcohol dehydrogenase [Clostridia bacterium]|nr:iron-containing alcohol dehydrogenase [Clostridia bacterium]